MVFEKFSIGLYKSAPGRLFLLLIGGALTGLVLIFPVLGPLEWLTLVPAAYVLLGMAKEKKTGLGRAYGYGFFFFMSFYIVIYHWFLYLYPLEFTGMSRASALAVVCAGWFGLSLLQALVGGLIFPLALLLGRTKLVCSHRIILPFVAASLWAVFEWSQTLFWSGVPWARLAIGQTGAAVMIGASSLFGSYFITFVIVAVNFLLAFAVWERRKAKISVICAAGLMLLCAALGSITVLSWSDKDEKKFTAGLIQANIGSGDKWDVSISDMLDIYSDYTRLAAAEGADIIIWPETSVPASLERKPNLLGRLCDLADECGTPIIVGTFTYDTEGNEFNSLVLIEPGKRFFDEGYNKRHLVPFGEYLPLRTIISFLIPPLTEIAMLEDDLTPGRDSGILESGGVRFGSLICFDSIYEELARASVLDGAEVLVVSTNDSWFYDSAAGRMHNAQAKLRAVESGRYVLRAANTGISSVITPTGAIIDQLEPLRGGYIVAEVGAREGKTLYMLTGNLFVALCALFCLLLPAHSAATRILRKNKMLVRKP